MQDQHHRIRIPGPLDLDSHNLQLAPSLIGADPQPTWAAVRGRNTCWRRSRHHEADRSSSDPVATCGLGEPDLQYPHSVRHLRLCQTEPKAECEPGLAAGPVRPGRHTGHQRVPRERRDLRYRPRNSRSTRCGSVLVSGTPPATHTMTGTTCGLPTSDAGKPTRPGLRHSGNSRQLSRLTSPRAHGMFDSVPSPNQQLGHGVVGVAR